MAAARVEKVLPAPTVSVAIAGLLQLAAARGKRQWAGGM